MAQKGRKVKGDFSASSAASALYSAAGSVRMVPAGSNSRGRGCGEAMSNRSWFFAAGDQQQGPYGEADFRDLIGRGVVRADTLVWTEGMAAWQKAGDIPGLLSDVVGAPAVRGAPDTRSAAGGYGSGSLRIDFGIWDLTWRSVAFFLGSLFVIPVPWLAIWYVRWIVSCTGVPGRPELSFTGRALTLAPWFFGAVILEIAAAVADMRALTNLMAIVWLFLYWLALKWFFANLASNGRQLGLSFSGSFWAYFGWNLLAALSVITIIGWAWVYTAMIRWMCRNIQGTRREVVFKGTGLEYLWRMIVTVIASAFIIPIPFVFRWLIRWQASQTEFVERNTLPRT
jgi:hypothetical protein